MTKTVPALTFCLTLLAAPAARAGGSSGSVDALTLLKTKLRSCVERTACEEGVPVTLQRRELQCTICGQPFEPELQRSAARAKEQLCGALKLLPLVPLPASCQAEPLQHATNDTTARM